MATRRQLLTHIGMLAGAGPLVGALQALGIGGYASAQERPAMPANLGSGKSVVVLGAGISGLVSACSTHGGWRCLDAEVTGGRS